MADYLSKELGGSANVLTPQVGYRPSADVVGGRVRRLRATVTLASQTVSDRIVLGTLPQQATFCYGVLTSTVSLGASTVSVGTIATPAKYRALSTFTSVDTPTMFGKASEVGAAAPGVGVNSSENLYLTIAAASLPASGTLVVDVYYSTF